jgi:uncharacterized protein
MLQTNVAQLLKNPIGAERSMVVDDELELAEFGKCHVSGSLKLVRTNRSILVKGTLSTRLELECARCLEIYKCPMEFLIEEEYFPMVEVASGLEVEGEFEAGAFVIDENFVFDISEAVRQYAVMTMPMKPLCRQDCAGIVINK